MPKKLENQLINKIRNAIGKIDAKSIIDVIIFGSAIKGKESPLDIDLCIIFREREDQKIIEDMRDKIQRKGLNAHLSFLTADEFFTRPHSLIQTLLKEGVSIITKKRIAENYGLSSWMLYYYNLVGLKESIKVRFVYLLKGRNKKGIVEELEGEWLTNAAFIVPIKNDEKIKEILTRWKIPFKRKIALLMD